MAAMTTALTYFSSNGNKITYTLPGSTTQKPKVMVCQRKVPVGKQTVAEFKASVIHTTTNADGEILLNKPSISTLISSPIHGQSTDMDAVVTTYRDWVNSDEFLAAVSGLTFPAH